MVNQIKYKYFVAANNFMCVIKIFGPYNMKSAVHVKYKWLLIKCKLMAKFIV